MITIRIGSNERSYSDADAGWINQQINRRRHDGQLVCAQVVIDAAGVNMVLSTLACARSGGGGRPPNSRESSIFDLWNKRGLNSNDFNGGQLIAFLKQLPQFL